MSRSFVGVVAFVLISGILHAQEFWMMPRKFTHSSGEEIKIDFRTGNDFEGELADPTQYGITAFQWYSISPNKDFTKIVKATKGNNYTAKPPGGTQLYLFQTRNKTRSWSAAEFETYLEENGLDNVKESRAKSSLKDQPAKEEFTYYSKLLIQVGTRTDDTYKKKTGARLEIIPEKNPFTMASGDYLKCVVLFDGKPSPHTMVKVWSRINQTAFLQNVYTEDDGTITFPISTKGAWMVSAVRMIPSTKPGTDWESIWGSLVFGIE